MNRPRSVRPPDADPCVADRENGTVPVTASVAVLAPREHAFSVFTERLHEWWPLDETSIGGRRRVVDVVVEPVAGGRVYERWRHGEEHDWAAVVCHDAPARLALAWQRPATAEPTEVSVHFDEETSATCRVTVRHSGFERLGDDGAGLRDDHARAWPGVLARFATAATDPVLHRTLATRLNHVVWQTLADEQRTAEDELAMVHAVHASAHHWYAVGGPAQQTRAEWLCSRVYAVVGAAEAALVHARTALAIVEENPRVVAPFDEVYAAEAIARAYAVGGRPEEAQRWRDEAERRLAGIPDAEDRALVSADLAAGPWHPPSG